MKIQSIKGRIIFDSRGFPTLEAECTLEPNFTGMAAVPSGASTGSKEALELRDGNSNEFSGKGVNKALSNLTNAIAPVIVGKEFNSQEDFDNFLIELDGTENKSKLGANAILACSLAFAKAYAQAQGKQFYEILGTEYSAPRPMMNIINGGAHADNNVEIQEFMIVPLKYDSFFECMKIGVEIFHALKKALKADGFSTNVGDEGGFAPNLESNEQAIEYILSACKNAGYTPGTNVALALDAASNEFYKDGKYYPEPDSRGLSSQELVDYYGQLIEKYPIISMEDPFEESDYEGWKAFTAKFGDKIQIVGDDLYVTNPKLLQNGIENGFSNAILIKPNQIGTLTETLEAIKIAKNNGFGTVISHRSGETEDTSIAHIAIGTNARQIKTGSLSRSDRMAKYNEILRLMESIS